MSLLESPPTGATPGPPAGPPRKRRVWRRVSGLVAASAPTVAFVIANALSSLSPAIIVAAAIAVAIFIWRLGARAPLRQAVVGLGIVMVCAGVAAITGQARGFFLVPALIPFAVIAVCLATLAAGKPLTGLLLNRVVGGARDWQRVPGLYRVYVVSTIAALAINVLNAFIQVTFYLADKPVVLAAAHVATGPVFAVLVAVTIGYARRATIAQQL